MKTSASAFAPGSVGSFLGRILFACFLAASVLAGCGGGGGGGDSPAPSSGAPVTTPPPAPAVLNMVPVTVDRGPAGANAFNIPFVSVTVCRPGTSVCQTIDHVMVDTGSYGLRLVKQLDAALGLPAVTAPSGAAAGECGQFISGYTWGAIVQADVTLGGKTARAQSIQAVGQAPGGVGTAPAACANLGTAFGTAAALGANGILGIGQFREDCGLACTRAAIDATYYACSSGACTPTAMPLDRQVANPVAGFDTDNNGVILAMPAVGRGGADSLAGTLTFGIGTQSNNALGNATVLTADRSGTFTTIYRGRRLTSSFIDSGSNGLFFDDATIPECDLSKGFYCPPRPLSSSATMVGTNGASVEIPFTIEDVDALDDDVRAAWTGGPNSSHPNSAGDGFTWGLPFFYGRRVYVGIESATSDPYWAF